MNYCRQCGHKVDHSVPPGDNRQREICPNCGLIHYDNPKVVVGCVPVWEDRILLCKRAIEPRRGFWTMPAGFLELNESMGEGAARETLEEACARVEIQDQFAVMDVLHAGQVHVFFTARMTDGDFAPGAESLETELYEVGDIPWDDLAFPSVEFALRAFLDNRAKGSNRLHESVVRERVRWP